MFPLIYQPSRDCYQLFSGYDCSDLYWETALSPKLLRACEAVVAISAINRRGSRDYFCLDISRNHDVRRFTELAVATQGLKVKNILELHRVLTGIARSSFRSTSLRVGSASEGYTGFIAPVYNIKAEVEWLLDAAIPLHSDVVCIAFFLFYFLHVHPFLDGNGRVSRVILSSIFLRRSPRSREMALFFLALIEIEKGSMVRAMSMARMNSAADFLDYVRRVVLLRNKVESQVDGFEEVSPKILFGAVRRAHGGELISGGFTVVSTANGAPVCGERF